MWVGIPNSATFDYITCGGNCCFTFNNNCIRRSIADSHHKCRNNCAYAANKID